MLTAHVLEHCRWHDANHIAPNPLPPPFGMCGPPLLLEHTGLPPSTRRVSLASPRPVVARASRDWMLLSETSRYLSSGNRATNAGIVVSWLNPRPT